ncbi:MAG: winged helix-turn-helix transcriptional regulator [Flavobacteriales bacterium]|nr:MAG: winged helix-turn-helix transcriptional regulator [Flavobacteriales bacterium]
MVAIITGDIIASRKLVNQEKWLIPLKKLFSTWGESPKDWKLDRGDFFQVEIKKSDDALLKALEIKALIKKVAPLDERKKISTIDVRLAIGIGEKNYTGESISESNGSAFINSGEKFDLLKKENSAMGIKSPWKSFDSEMNLYLKLASIFMDKWSVSSAEVVQIVLKNPGITQEEIGKQLGIKQSGVSRRWNRANVNEILEVEKMYRNKIKSLLQ